jgi:hypothetical protein
MDRYPVERRGAPGLVWAIVIGALLLLFAWLFGYPWG